MRVAWLSVARLTALSVLLSLTLACGGDSPVAASPWGVIRVSVQTSGGDVDIDGYDVVIDGARRQLIFTRSAVPIGNVPAGPHTVALDRVAENCAISGAGSRSVEVTRGDTVDVAFEVVCVATGISITTRTSGQFAPPSYRVVGVGIETQVPVNGVTVVGRLQPGTYVLELTTNGNHCSVAGGPRVTVDVRARETSAVVFDITCVAPIRSPKIAFVFDSVMNGVTTQWIGLVDLDGSNRVPVGRGRSPDWSPDGTRLAYSDAACTDYYYGFCSGGVIVVDPETRTTYRLSDGTASFEPVWAPTRNAMAVVRSSGSLLGPGALWVVAVDGVTAPSRIQLPPGIAGDNPAWSPDGERIAFSCTVGGRNRDICLVSMHGGDARRLTTNGVVNTDPAWSPDGTRIAFSTGSDVVIASVPDARAIPLASGYTPAWSPDGNQLVIARDDGLYIINADGTGTRRLTTGRHSSPAWRP